MTVTARRREEEAIDVPLSVTAITAESEQRLVLDGIQDYIRQVPGATLVNSGPEYLNDFTLRGQGGGRQQFSESSTGIYKDGSYDAGGIFGGRQPSRLDLFDIERLEVLRGPQGAIRPQLGRRQINTVSRRPDPDELGGARARELSGLRSGDRRGGGVENSSRRYSIGNRTEGLVRNADGSLEIVISQAPPASGGSANWLPAPAGPFRMSFRAYLPRPEFQSLRFVLPPVGRDDGSPLRDDALDGSE